MRRSVLRKTPCRVGRQYKGFASLATGLQAACSPLDFLLRSANVSTLISVSGNIREYHCSRQKVRLRHCRPPCSIRCRVASVACSSCKNLLRYRFGLRHQVFTRRAFHPFSKVRLRLVILPGSRPDSHVTRSCEWRFPSENSSTSLTPPRPALPCLEIAPSSQLTFEKRGIGHSAGRRSRPAQ